MIQQRKLRFAGLFAGVFLLHPLAAAQSSENAIGNAGEREKINVHINLDPEIMRTLPVRRVEEVQKLHEQLTDSENNADAHYFTGVTVTNQRLPPDEVPTLSEHDLQTFIRQNQNTQRVVNNDAPPVIVKKEGSQPTGVFRRQDLKAEYDSSADLLTQIGKSVGRIESDGVLLGTGFVIGTDEIITNCHVIAGFTGLGPDGNAQLRGHLEIDFGDSPEHDESAEFRITAIDRLPSEAGADAVMLHVRHTSVSGNSSLPSPLQVGHYNRTKLPVAVIGYPDLVHRDSRATPLTAEEYAKVSSEKAAKIATLGYITDKHDFSDFSVLDHTSSTAGGNSGSPIVNLANGTIVGIHFCCTSSGYEVNQTSLPCANWKLLSNTNMAIDILSPVLGLHEAEAQWKSKGTSSTFHVRRSLAP